MMLDPMDVIHMLGVWAAAYALWHTIYRMNRDD
jgi:hypothetical protein